MVAWSITGAAMALLVWSHHAYKKRLDRITREFARRIAGKL